MKAIVVATVTAVSLTAALSAQAPAQNAPAPPSNPLPLRRVVLYKSGVAHFEHLGRVRGNQEVTISFTSGQLDDVLKSLTAIDLDGGRVSGIQYNSQESLDRRLSALRLPVGQQATRAQFLAALRGARLEVQSAGQRITGRLLSVETVARRVDNATISVETLALVGDAGDVRSVPLEPGATVRLLDRELSEEVSKYLSLVGSVRDQDVRRLAISTVGTGDRELLVSYVTEAPVWKSTFRIVLPGPGDDRPPFLQGWAVVDNTAGEDWRDVELSLVAGAPQAFVQQISRPLYVRRPTVALAGYASLMPQTHQQPTSAKQNITIDGVGSGFFSLTPPRMDATETVTVASAAPVPTPPASPRSATTEVTFVTRSSVDSQTAMRRQLSEADAARMGDLFEYKIKERVTIRKGQSALVPILTGDIRAEKVSIWNASEDSRRAMRALWITNTTGLTLDGGSFSVVDGQSFAGEGLMDPLKPGERRLLSFALDLGLTVDAGDQEDTEKVTSVRVERGVMRQTVQERRKVTYTMRNKDAERKVVIVEHPAEDGWTLAGLTADETTADWHRFRVEVAPGESKTLVVEEEHPYCEDLQVSALTDDQLTLLVRARALDSALEAWLKDVQARKSALAGLNAQGQRHKAEIEQIAADQKRVRENMLALKGSIEERLLIRRYVQQLDEQETRLRTLNDELRAILAETEKAQADLNRIIEGAGSM